MALTIGSVGDRAEQRRNLLIHSLGVIAGSLVMGLTLVLLGEVLQGVLAEVERPMLVIAIALLVGWAVYTSVGVGIPFPNSRWQVPKDWRHTLPFEFTVGAYGFLLGLGVLTNVVVPVIWVLVGASLAIANTPTVLFIWLAYGITRASVTAREALAVGESDDPGGQQARPSHLRLVKTSACALLLMLAVTLVL